MTAGSRATGTRATGTRSQAGDGRRYYLGIDIGTGQSKAALVDETCTPVRVCSVEHDIQNPRPGWYQMDADGVWWGDFCTLCQRVITETGIDPAQTACVGLSALGCDCVPVDAAGHALAPAVLYGIDSRASAQIAWLKARYAGRETEVFGHELCSSDVAPKIRWFRDEMPEVWERADKFLTGSSYLSMRLTGQVTIDRYLAEDWMPLYDFGADRIDERGCEGICRPDQLARLAAATDIAGTVTARAAGETGLAAGTPVLVGTGDSGAEAISTGVFLPGDIMVQMGSTCYFIYLSDHRVREDRFWPGTFIIPDTWALCAGTNTAGTLTRWMRDELYPDAVAAQEQGGPDAFAVMAADAASVPPGAGGLICLPYFAGERTPLNDPLARGTFFGLLTNHTRAHMTRAAIEGIACTIAQHFEVLAEDGLAVNKIMCTGGGTKNEVWLQAVADMLERPVYTTDITIGAAYGDALMAAVGCGDYRSWNDLAQVVQPSRTVEPRPETYPVYRKLRRQFKALYEATKDIAHELDAPAAQ